MQRAELRIGVDVGGTNTDAAVVGPGQSVLGKAKVPTTHDAIEGVRSAVDAALSSVEERPSTSPFSRAHVSHLMLGTTTIMNAVLERRGLNKVAALRLAAPATLAVRPLGTWPDALRGAVSVAETVVGGGVEFDGRDIVALDAEAVKRFCAGVAGRADAVAITSVFSPVSEHQELAAAEIVRHELGEVDVCLSHRIGSLGLVERENATVLNAALLHIASKLARAVEKEATALGLDATVLFSQNDGTLMSSGHLLEHPVFTIGSGAANSMLGAAWLAGLADAVVVDLGGTSTDVGMLSGGYPRQAPRGMTIGGVRTNFRAPDVVSVALGGGSLVARGARGTVEVGPHSVASRIAEEAVCLGGDSLTLTDAGVAASRMDIGDADRLARHREILAAAIEKSDRMLGQAVDTAKASRAPVPLIAVGGGSALVPERVPGVSDVVRPDHFEVANAIGAAHAKVGGQVDRIVHMGRGDRRALLNGVAEEACEAAVRAGADPDTVEVVALDETPLAYLTTPSVRVVARAVGELTRKGA